MMRFAGIDIGSTAIKIALIDAEGALSAWSVTPTGSLFRRNALAAWARLCAEEGIAPGEVTALAATGYGRKLLSEADYQVSEVTANAEGACGRLPGGEPVRTIINIGGQDLKVIALDDEGLVRDFAMNDKCAAGTGRFLEMAARSLGWEVSELGARHLAAAGTPALINSTCAVFAESEIIGLLAAGHGPGEIAAGIHYAIARRVARMARRLGCRETVLFDGGPALNAGLLEALRNELMCEIRVPELPELTTAYGAALLGRRRHAAGGGS